MTPTAELDYAACYNKALDLLSRRAHFRRELERKLQQRGFAQDDVSAVLERLEREAFLDDRAAAERFVESRRSRRGETGLRLVQELRKRGVDADLASEVVGPPDREEDLRRAAELVESMSRRGAERDRIARALARKGFGKGVILDVLPAP